MTTPRLSLRVPTHEQLEALAELSAQGVHDPAVMPFYVPWTDALPAERARSTMQHLWRNAADWTPDDWALSLVAVEGGTVVGMQSLHGRAFAVTGEVSTGSWLGREHHGRGIGTEMREAVLHLAFAGLGASTATSGAFLDNPSSLGVSRKLNYREDGVERRAVRGAAATAQRLRLDRTGWEPRRRDDIDIVGLDGCRTMFGI